MIPDRLAAPVSIDAIEGGTLPVVDSSIGCIAKAAGYILPTAHRAAAAAADADEGAGAGGAGAGGATADGLPSAAGTAADRPKGAAAD